MVCASSSVSLGFRDGSTVRESSLCLQWAAKDPRFLHTDTQADLSLRWAHMPYCWFCRAAAHMLYKVIRNHGMK